MHVYYRDEYVVAAHSFDTTRKAGWVARSLRERPIAGVELEPPPLLTESQLQVCHDAAYIEAVRTGAPASLACSQGFEWDPGMWIGARASNGGALAAALEALRGATSGSLSSGLHHARRGYGRGFCTFNGLAIAARAVLRAGAARVLIVDLDAHCGGGTHSLIADEPRIHQLDVSVCSVDGYEATGGNTLDIVSDAARYLPAIRRRLEDVRDAFDLALYNAGMDPFEGCQIGGLPGVTEAMLEERENLVFEWCRRRSLPVAFVLAGGYVGPRLSQSTLVDLHRVTLATAAAN